MPQLGSRKSGVGRNRELGCAPATRYADDGALRSRVHADELFVEVADTGVGIPRAQLSQIFEPFFTT